MKFSGGQSSPSNSSRLMDILGNTPVFYKTALREYKSQIIKKNALQEIAEFLKAAHGVNLNKCRSICLESQQSLSSFCCNRRKSCVIS